MTEKQCQTCTEKGLSPIGSPRHGYKADPHCTQLHPPGSNLCWPRPARPNPPPPPTSAPHNSFSSFSSLPSAAFIELRADLPEESRSVRVLLKQACAPRPRGRQLLGPAGRVWRRGCGRRRDALFTTGPGAAPAAASAPIRSRRCLLASARPPSGTQGDRGEGSAVLSWKARAVLRGCLRPAPGAGAALAAGKQLALTISLRKEERCPQCLSPARNDARARPFPDANLLIKYLTCT